MIFILRRILKYFSFIFKIFENRGIKKYGLTSPKHCPIFIIGVPRSGTTIVYQILTNYFNVSYINNLVNLSRPNVYFGFQLSNWFFKNKPHNSYHSNFGNTQKEGLNAPSEAGQIWYKWLPKGDLILNKENVSKTNQDNLKKTLNALLNRYNKPIIIKNLYFVLRIKLLRFLFPDAKFIIIKRDPLFIAESLYKGRLNNNNIKDWWSIKPPEISKFSDYNEIEQIIKQVYYLEKRLYDDLNGIDQKNVIELNYEDLDNLNHLFFEKMGTFIGVDKRINEVEIIPDKITVSNKHKIDQKIVNQFQEEIKKYNWENNHLVWKNTK